MERDLAEVKDFLINKYYRLKAILPLGDNIDQMAIWTINLSVLLASFMMIYFNKIVILLIILLAFWLL